MCSVCGYIREACLQFVPVTYVSGNWLSSVIVDSLTEFGVNLAFLRGQKYDGAGAMSVKFNGVEKHVCAYSVCTLQLTQPESGYLGRLCSCPQQKLRGHSRETVATFLLIPQNDDTFCSNQLLISVPSRRPLALNSCVLPAGLRGMTQCSFS